MEGRSFGLTHTRHAQKAALEDRYGRVTLPAVLTIGKGEIVEAEVTNGFLTKLVVRQSLDLKRDAIYVIIPMGAHATLKTVWCNLKTDKHRTLKRHLYAKAA